jgi:hypothetical protein
MFVIALHPARPAQPGRTGAQLAGSRWPDRDFVDSIVLLPQNGAGTAVATSTGWRHALPWLLTE